MWPPPAFDPAYSAYRDWDALYAGDPDRLRAVFQGRGYGPTSPNRTRPSQYAGGVVGRLSRWFWGSPPTPGVRDARLHLPLPADVASVAASVLFSEPIKLTPPEDAPEGVAERFEQLLADGFQATLRQAAEVCSALGDVYLRPVIDREVWPDRAQLVPVHADGALPRFRWGHLVEVTFHQELLHDDTRVVRLLEHHKPGRVEYALFDGTLDNLGRRIPLTEFDQSEWLADIVDADGGQDTGLDRLDVVRIPNAMPQRLWRTNPALKYLGRSDFCGLEPWFDAADEVWSSWMRDIRLAKGRIIVPESMLSTPGPGLGAQWDAEREVFTGLTMLDEGSGSQSVTINQFAIRTAEHQTTLAAIQDVILRADGISQQTVGESGDVAMTATEAQAKERRTFITRDVRVDIWQAGGGEAVETLMAFERHHFGDGRPEPVRPLIEFGDSVSESPETTARTIELLRAAKAISIRTGVEMAHPDWEPARVDQEVRDILAEEPVASDPTAMGDVNPLGDGADGSGASDVAADEPSDA